MWDQASLSPDQANPATSAAAGCLGRFPLPCGAGPVAWVSARPDDQSNANAGATANPYAKPLLCVGCDDGNIQVLAWDAKKKSLTKFVSSDRVQLFLFCLSPCYPYCDNFAALRTMSCKFRSLPSSRMHTNVHLNALHVHTYNNAGFSQRARRRHHLFCHSHFKQCSSFSGILGSSSGSSCKQQ